MLGDLLEIDVRRERHRAGMNPEYLQPRVGIRNADFDFAIEAPGTPQRRVKNLRNVGRPDDDDLAARNKAIHQAEKLCHDPLFDLAAYLGAFGSHGIDLVDEQDRGRVTGRFLENLAELGLALAVELPHDFRAVEVNEVHAALGGYGAGKQRLTRARRTIEEHAFWRENSQPLEDARKIQFQFDP